MIATAEKIRGTSEADTLVVRWPPEQFYWAVLDAPGFRRGGVVPDGLAQDLADQLSIPLEEVHAVAQPIEGGRLLVCAALRNHLSGVPVEARSLSPTGIPPELDQPEFEAATFNLLVGEFEPRSIRRRHSRRRLSAAALALVATALLAVGLSRRARHDALVVVEARDAAARTFALTGVAGSNVKELAEEVDRRRRAARLDLSTRLPTDAAVALASLLEAWPKGVASFAQSAAIGSEGATVAVLVPGDPATFLAALKPPPGWRIDEPRLIAVDNQTRLTITMRPAKEATR